MPPQLCSCLCFSPSLQCRMEKLRGPRSGLLWPTARLREGWSEKTFLLKLMFKLNTLKNFNDEA